MAPLIDEIVTTGKRNLMDRTHWANKEPTDQIPQYYASACGASFDAHTVRQQNASKVTCSRCISWLISNDKLKRS